eukprot:tig00000865_g5106.t1
MLETAKRTNSPKKYEMPPDSPELGRTPGEIDVPESPSPPHVVSKKPLVPAIRASSMLHPNSPGESSDGSDPLPRPTSAMSAKHFSIEEQEQSIPTLREDRDAMPRSVPYAPRASPPASSPVQMFTVVNLAEPGQHPLVGAGALSRANELAEQEGAGIGPSAPTRVASAPPLRVTEGEAHERARRHWQHAMHEIALRGMDDGTGPRPSTERRKQASRSKWNALLSIADPRGWHFYNGPKIGRAPGTEAAIEKKLDKVHKSSASEDARRAELRCMLVKLKQKKRPDAKDAELTAKIQRELKELEEVHVQRARSPSVVSVSMEPPGARPSVGKPTLALVTPKGRGGSLESAGAAPDASPREPPSPGGRPARPHTATAAVVLALPFDIAGEERWTPRTGP